MVFSMHLSAITLIVIVHGCWGSLCNKPSHPVPTFFRNKHANGTLVDAASPEYTDIEKGPWINKIKRSDATTIKIEAWPSTVKNGDYVEILWQNVSNPTPIDFVIYYCPYYDSDYYHYIDYFHITVSSSWKSGYGHHKVQLFNMRESCIFKYYRREGKAKILAAHSNLVEFADGGPQAPLHGHIAMTNDPTQMRVMWVSGEVDKPPVVRYGTTKELEMKEFAHIIHTYNKDSLCHEPALKKFWKPGITYDFLLTNLKPNTFYYYAYGTEDYMSHVVNFTTPLPKGDPTPYKFVIYGDMGATPLVYPRPLTTAQLVRKEVETNGIRFVTHIGDISYARGYAYLWDIWGWLIEPYATLVPYMLGTGNHEYDHIKGGKGRDPSGVVTEDGWRPWWFDGSYDSGGECGVPLYHRYHMPDNGNSLFWYSFDYGMVHMLMFSTEHDFTPGSQQYTWMENDLKNVDRKLTPWLMVGGHRPMYSSEKYECDRLVAVHMQKYLEPLLYKYKTDIAWWGHQHTHERTCKLYENNCVDDGIVHLIVGNAGHHLDGNGYNVTKWSLKHVKEFGFGRVTVANATSLLFEMIGNKHYTVRDSLWLHK